MRTNNSNILTGIPKGLLPLIVFVVVFLIVFSGNFIGTLLFRKTQDRVPNDLISTTRDPNSDYYEAGIWTTPDSGVRVEIILSAFTKLFHVLYELFSDLTNHVKFFLFFEGRKNGMKNIKKCKKKVRKNTIN